MWDFQEENKNKTVVLGMSGGVDSSVCAIILKNAGFNVIGLFMKNWEEFDEFGVCQASKEYADVVAVCEKLEIPYYSVDFIEEYKKNVFDHFLSEYEQGFTPNPDILCNREIKFKVFFEKAMQMGADYLATGHYCQKEFINQSWQLKKGHDMKKDQSYFLYTIKSEILKKVLFPIGHLDKTEVRKLAAKYDLKTKDKKDSTGICFIGERNFKNFLSQYLHFKSGEFQTLAGEKVGTHSGSAFYTLGQRKGLGLGGAGEPWFVVGKDTQKNIVFVERGEFHPALYADSLTANELSFVDHQFELNLPLKCTAKIRYRQVDTPCTIVSKNGDTIEVIFDNPQRAITVRQSIVFYLGDICLGGGMIKASGESYYTLKKAFTPPNSLDH